MSEEFACAAGLDNSDVARPCRHRRILDQGPAGRFCAECGERVGVATCGAVHRRARAVCTLPAGHGGDHCNAHGYWMPGPDEQWRSPR